MDDCLGSRDSHLEQGWLLVHNQLGEALEHFHLYSMKGD